MRLITEGANRHRSVPIEATNLSTPISLNTKLFRQGSSWIPIKDRLRYGNDISCMIETLRKFLDEEETASHRYTLGTTSRSSQGSAENLTTWCRTDGSSVLFPTHFVRIDNSSVETPTPPRRQQELIRLRKKYINWYSTIDQTWCSAHNTYLKIDTFPSSWKIQGLCWLAGRPWAVVGESTRNGY